MVDIDEIREKKKNQKQNLIIRYNIDYLKEALIDHTQKYFGSNMLMKMQISDTCQTNAL